VLRLAVENDASPRAGAPAADGVGLSNTRERLLRLYGGAQSVAAGQRGDGGFSVVLELPFEALRAPAAGAAPA